MSDNTDPGHERKQSKEKKGKSKLKSDVVKSLFDTPRVKTRGSPVPLTASRGNVRPKYHDLQEREVPDSACLPGAHTWESGTSHRILMPG